MIPEVARPSRRRAVAVAALAIGAAGCSHGAGSASDGRAGTRPPQPGVAEQAAAARDSAALAARYDAVTAAHPSLAGRLAPLRAEVARHVTAFGGVVPLPSATATTDPPPVALAVLAGAERTLADRRAKVLLEVPGELARLMASVAAAGAGHAALLSTTG